MSAWSRRHEFRQDAHGRGPFTLVGFVCLLIGLYFLINPEAPNDPSALAKQLEAFDLPSGTEIPHVVNLQLLVIGETLTLMGTIFLAVAWRPMRDN